MKGEDSLIRWLKALPESPWLISDAFPAGCLPRPLLAPERLPRQAPEEDKATFTERLQKVKKQKKQLWISVQDFLALRKGLSGEALNRRLVGEQGKVVSYRQAHNTINRLTGTTPEIGGLYFMEERWHGKGAEKLDVYLQAPDASTEQLRHLFTMIGEQGFGRDASLGRGRFSVEEIAAADPALFQYTGNRLLSLSHGSLTPNMRAPRYKLHVHYGKLGGLFAGGVRSPFKRPLLLLKPGATFEPAREGPFGEWLSDVHPDHPEIGHHAWHLCLPYTETEVHFH
jgi:CRISPR-associated protein Csm4